MRNVEVNQKSKLETTELQIREHLSCVNGQQLLHTLNLDDQAFFHDEINAVCGRQLHFPVPDGQAHLVLNMQAGHSQFIEQARANGALQHPGTKSTVNFQRAADDRV